MKSPFIRKVHKDLSVPWFEQIRKEILFPGEAEPQIYYSIKPSDYVTALTHTTDNKILLLRQFRPAVENYTFELPSGHKEDGETPAEAMVRELREETGCVPGDVTLMRSVIPDTGRLENRLWAFYISNIDVKHIPSPQKNEGIEVHLVTRKNLFKMINNGQLNHALDLSVIALAVFQNYLKL